MTIKELIQQLQQLDPDLHVFTNGYEGGYCDVSSFESKEIALDVMIPKVENLLKNIKDK